MGFRFVTVGLWNNLIIHAISKVVEGEGEGDDDRRENMAGKPVPISGLLNALSRANDPNDVHLHPNIPPMHQRHPPLHPIRPVHPVEPNSRRRSQTQCQKPKRLPVRPAGPSPDVPPRPATTSPRRSPTPSVHRPFPIARSVSTQSDPNTRRGHVPHRPPSARQTARVRTRPAAGTPFISSVSAPGQRRASKTSRRHGAQEASRSLENGAVQDVERRARRCRIPTCKHHCRLHRSHTHLHWHQFLTVYSNRCFCLRMRHPAPPRIATPHSCAQPCSRPRSGCGHACPLPCHPGPCPPCAVTIQVACFCGKERHSAKCQVGLTASSFSCTQPCRKRLRCGNSEHVCAETCHEGPCSPCPEREAARCWCGRETKHVGCGEAKVEEATECIVVGDDGSEQVWIGSYGCGHPCQRYDSVSISSM